jgi:RimJ/RimL family protein N-acetyltransferase
MGPLEFSNFHTPALANDEVRHGVILNILARANAERQLQFRYWTLGEAGECAVQIPPHSIVLGAPEKRQCRTLADLTAQLDYPGVVGPEATATWFVDRATELGVRFQDPVGLRILALTDRPRYPGATGNARTATDRDLALVADWTLAFHREAIPNDPTPSPQEFERIASEGNCLFWLDNGQPVAMARIVRPLKNSAAITGVYTPPESRGRGYAGSVTAALVERIHAEGRPVAYLYADLNNPFSNRCYEKIGFSPVCNALHYYRCGQMVSAPG